MSTPYGAQMRTRKQEASRRVPGCIPCRARPAVTIFNVPPHLLGPSGRVQPRPPLPAAMNQLIACIGEVLLRSLMVISILRINRRAPQRCLPVGRLSVRRQKYRGILVHPRDTLWRRKGATRARTGRSIMARR